MCHDGIVAVLQVLFTPDLFEQLFGGNDLAFMIAEVPQYGKLQRCQTQFLIVKGAGMGIFADD